MKSLMILIASIMGCINFASAYEEISGRVIAVVDGTTLEIASNDKQIYRIRLAGIDSPELAQEYGEEAKEVLEKLALEKNVQVKITGKDRWGRYLGEMIIDGKTDPRIELLKRGLTWTSEKSPLPDLEEYRVKAQQKGKGLWKQADPTPPWIFRRQQTMLQAKSS
jgi:endonuclease YncB( thermonuclease family)